MRIVCVCLCVLLAACGPEGGAGSIEPLGVEVAGPAFADDAEAVDVFAAAFKALDSDGMRSVWGRMSGAQRLAADMAVGQWLDGLSTDDYARFEDAQAMLRDADWGAIRAAQ